MTSQNIAYIRVSTDKQELENQKLAILNYSNNAGFKIDRFVEQVISSRKKQQKKQIEEEIEKLQAGDTLIVAELSRIGRSLGQIISLIDELNNRNIKFVAIKENIQIHGQHDTTSKVMITMIGLFAELERDLISQRTKDGLRRAKASGKTLGRPKGKLGKSKLDGKEKEIAGYLDKKVSKASICKILEVTPPTLDNFIKTRKLEAGDLLKSVQK